MQASSAIDIRRAMPADAPRLHALLERYFEEWNIWKRDTPETVLAIIYQERELGFFVAESGADLLGCVYCFRLARLRKSAELKRLYVLPEARGQGIADRLFSSAETSASQAGMEWMYLDSTSDFKAALALYGKHGYLACERYNDNPQATLFFRKSLS